MISVVIPAYNAEKFLAACLDSVIEQDTGEWEAIVVDDGSTDSTLSIARGYAGRNPRIKVFSKSNGGLSDARNFGVDKAQGEYITFLDSDDTLPPWALSRLSSLAPGAEIVSGRLVCLSPASAGEVRSTRMKGTAALEEGLYQTGISTSACGKLYARNLFDRVRFIPGIWYEDLDFFARVMPEVSTVAVTDTPVYVYRQNPDSFIHRFTPARLDVLKVTEGIERIVAEKYPGLLPAARSRRLSACFNMYALLDIHDREGKYAAEKASCLKIIRGYRRGSLFNPRVRLKNKAGILLSYLGAGIFTRISRLIYK